MNWVSSMFGSGGCTGSGEATLPVNMRFRLIAGMAAIAGAGANVVIDARLMAQDTPAELAGCLDVTVGPWVVETYEDRLHPRASHESYRIPPRIRFGGPDDRRPSLTRIVVPEDDPAASHVRFAGAELDGDSLRMHLTDGFTGVSATLGRSGDGWTGTARSESDVIPYQMNARPVAMSPVDCESPLPVPGDESAPLGRVVELEGGQAITLGEPLPEQLETVALPPFDWTWVLPTRIAEMELTTPRNGVGVVGRTRGLFGATDSIQVHTDPDGLVYSVRLLYVDAGARETLEDRLRSQYGAPGTASGVPDVHIYRNPSTSLWLRPWSSSRAEILLSDRRR